LVPFEKLWPTAFLGLNGTSENFNYNSLISKTSSNGLNAPVEKLHIAAMNEALCCCEYARGTDGETRHLLQCLCECEDFDKLADECFSAVCCDCCGCEDEEEGGAGGTTQQQQQHQRTPEQAAAARTAKIVERLAMVRGLLGTIADRARVPWFGGARQVNCGAVAALACLRAARLAAWLAPSDWAPWRLGVLGGAGGVLVGAHLLCLRLPWRTDFFPTWVLASVWGIYSDFRVHVAPTLPRAELWLAHALLALTLLSFALAVLWRPPGDRGGSGGGGSGKGKGKGAAAAADDDEDEEMCALQQHGDDDERSYKCRVCGGPAIVRRDHHCVWINQCVGAHNNRPFLAFVLAFGTLAWYYAWAALRVDGGGGGVVAVLAHAWALARAWRLPLPLLGAIYAALGGAFAMALAASQLMNISQGLTTHEQVRRDRHRGGGGARAAEAGNAAGVGVAPVADAVKRGREFSALPAAAAVAAADAAAGATPLMRAENWREWWRATARAQHRARWRWQ
jgi:hypothetical protein